MVVKVLFLEARLNTKAYISIPKGLVELGIMDKTIYEEASNEITGGMHVNMDATLLYFICLSEYVVDPNGLGLKQSKFYACILYRKCDNGNPEVIVICYTDNYLIIRRLETVQ